MRTYFIRVNNTDAMVCGDFRVCAMSTRAVSAGFVGESYRIMRQRFPSTLFTRLGGLFFATLVQRAVQHGVADLLVATRGREAAVDGFALVVHSRSWISETVRRYPAAFTLAATAALVRPALWTKLVSHAANRVSTRSADPRAEPDPNLPAHELYMMAVRHESEGEGCGRALIRGVDLRVRRSGSSRYSVFTQATNDRANRFYLRNGLTPVGNLKPIDMDMNVYVKDL